MAGAADAADPADATDSIEPAEAGAHASTSVLEQIKGIKDSKERPIEVVDLSGARPEAALGIDDGAPESPGGAAGTVDMVLDLTGETPGLLVSRSENSDSAVVAAVVPEAGATVDGEGLRRQARERLDGAHTPKRILVVPELPLRGPGKTDRHTVAALCRAV